MDKKFIAEQLFKPFSSTKKSKGMGIGAYQIRELIHSLQGEVFVDSEIGKGTKFLIYLPVTCKSHEKIIKDHTVVTPNLETSIR